jgi:TPR repeat protein
MVFTAKNRLIFLGIAAGVIVLACIVWFGGHPISPKAQYELGVKYANGQGVQKDDAKAVFWFRKAADRGNADAQEKLGEMYESGSGGLAKDDAPAVPWFRKAAEQGNAEAQSNLGVMYQNGEGGLKKDDAYAVSWYRKAAEQGYPLAQYVLGMSYEQGELGLAKDDAQAVSWYQKAGDQGYPYAKDSLDRVRARKQREKERNAPEASAVGTGTPIFSDGVIDVQRLDKKPYYGGCILTARIQNKSSDALNTVIIHVNGYDYSGTLTDNATFVFKDVPALGNAVKNVTGVLGSMPATVKIVDVSYR